MNHKLLSKLARVSLPLLAVALFGLVIIVHTPLVRGDDGGDHAEPRSNMAAIVVHLEPDRDDASITATRVSGDNDYLNGGSSPSPDVYTDFQRDGDAYVQNDVDIAAWCGSSLNFVNEYVQFDVEARAGDTVYSAGRVEVDCGEVAEITLRGEDNDNPGTVTFGLNYPNCNNNDQITAVPRDALVEIEGVGDDFSYRQQERRGLFTFSGLDPGVYTYSVTYADTEGEASTQRGYAYFYQDRFTVPRDGPVRINETLIGMPVSSITDETGACKFSNALPELPPISDFAEPTCTEKFPAVVGWAICAVLDWTDRAINKLVITLNNLLNVSPSEVNTAEMRKAWSFFRNIASLLLVVIGLIMIIGQAVSKD